ncbi:ABC transporter B family member mitochondrial-like, partial [Trifolium pratense]
MLAAASRHARPTAGSGNRIRSLLTASGITTGYSIPTTNGYRYGYNNGISYSNYHHKTCPSLLFSIKGFLSESSSSSSSSPSGRNLKVDGKALFSTSAKTDDGSQKNQKSSTTVAKSPPGGGQMADIKILKSLAGYIWMKNNLEFQFRVVAALFLLVGAK